VQPILRVLRIAGGLAPTAIRPRDVPTYIEQLLAVEASAPLVKQQVRRRPDRPGEPGFGGARAKARR
jgi:hypothetical protein